MIKSGDQFIYRGVLLEIKSALIDDNYIYVVWRIGQHKKYMRIDLEFFMKNYTTVESLVNINFSKTK